MEREHSGMFDPVRPVGWQFHFVVPRGSIGHRVVMETQLVALGVLYIGCCRYSGHQNSPQRCITFHFALSRLV